MTLIKILLAISTVLLAAVAGLLGVQTFNHPPDTWSYVILAPKDDSLIAELNKAGDAGWEIVSARRATSGESASYEMILKRHGQPPEQLLKFGGK